MVNSPQATVSGLEVRGNSARTNGGGIHNEAGAPPSISECLVSGNRRGAYGGGLCLTGSVPTPGFTTLVNCTVSGNLAGEYGGGVCLISFRDDFYVCRIVPGISASLEAPLQDQPMARE